MFLENCYFTETRPYNQGARLTAYELVHDKIPSTLVCDSTVAYLMKTAQISAVVVGADRVAANGDTANKIGTYQVSTYFFFLPSSTTRIFNQNDCEHQFYYRYLRINTFIQIIYLKTFIFYYFN